MVDSLAAIQLFVRVVEAGSFSQAAKQSGIGKSAASMQISRLEKQLGVRLLNRTTRQLGLTEAGRSYYQSCLRIVEEVQYAHEQLQNSSHQVGGKLRLTCPVGFGNRVVVPAASRFLEAHPEIELDLDLSDATQNLTEGGFDLAIRVGELVSSSLIARSLAKVSLLLVASPGYLERHGTPETIDALAGHQWVLSSHTPSRLPYEYEGVKYTIDTRGRITVNDEIARTTLVCQGHGLGLIPAYEAWEAIEKRQLVRVLEGYPIAASPINALYHDRRFLPQKVTVFLDSFSDYLREQSWIIN